MAIYTSRRSFLKGAFAATALGAIGQLRQSRLWAATPDELLPDCDESLLRVLALQGVDAARAAGAEFADIRVVGGQGLSVSGGFDLSRESPPGIGWPSFTYKTEYGVRVIIDGAWGFAGGSELSPGGIAAVARLAVARARANKPRRGRTIDLAPSPHVASGTWATPIAHDPFSVTVAEQANLILDALSEAESVPGVVSADVTFFWVRNLRVFASSEGSLTVQRVALAWPSASAVGRAGEQYRSARESVTTFHSGGYGYEAVLDSNLATELRNTAERAVEASRREIKSATSVDVGRFDLVLSGGAAASILSRTLGSAVDLERALGYQANRDGTSFAAPPAEILGQYQVGSPLLSVRADRTRPHSSVTVGWDDEGVPTGEHTIVQDGVIVDYLTTRQTAAELGALYSARGLPLSSRGNASGVGLTVPDVRLPNLTMLPGSDSSISVEELIADTKRGYYVEAAGGSSDQQVLSVQSGGGGVREIRNGKLGVQIKDFAFQFITPTFWKSMDAVGGAGSAVDMLVGTGYMSGDPLQLPSAVVTAIPARFREVNILNIGRTS